MNQVPTSALILKLIERQGELGLSHRQFALLLGIHESYWSLLRRGLREPGRELIEAALGAFPDLSYQYVAGLTIRKSQVDDRQASPESEAVA